MATNGLVLIKPSSVAKTGASSTATINAGGSVTFGLCETLSLNGVFSSTYDNYIIDVRGSGSNDVNVYARLRLSGTDASGSNYTYQLLEANSTTIGASRSSSQTNIAFGDFSNSSNNGYQVFIYGPALAQPTAGRLVTVNGRNSARLNDGAWTHSLSTAYDGLTIIRSSTDTLTGLVKVYGLVK